MIIICTSCNKKFEVNSDLIPETGRLLECSSCNNQFFFKNNQLIDKSTTIINQIKKPKENKITETKNLNINKSKKINTNVKNINLNDDEIKINKIKKKKIKNKSNLLSLTIVFIITFMALIILFDTFEHLISFITPNIETILHNLYETIKDVTSFIKDLF